MWDLYILVVSDFVYDGANLPMRVVFCNVYSFSNKVVCVKVFFFPFIS